MRPRRLHTVGRPRRTVHNAVLRSRHSWRPARCRCRSCNTCLSLLCCFAGLHFVFIDHPSGQHVNCSGRTKQCQFVKYITCQVPKGGLIQYKRCAVADKRKGVTIGVSVGDDRFSTKGGCDGLHDYGDLGFWLKDTFDVCTRRLAWNRLGGGRLRMRVDDIGWRSGYGSCSCHGRHGPCHGRMRVMNI